MLPYTRNAGEKIDRVLKGKEQKAFHERRLREAQARELAIKMALTPSAVASALASVSIGLGIGSIYSAQGIEYMLASGAGFGALIFIACMSFPYGMMKDAQKDVKMWQKKLEADKAM